MYYFLVVLNVAIKKNAKLKEYLKLLNRLKTRYNSTRYLTQGTVQISNRLPHFVTAGYHASLFIFGDSLELFW